MTAHDPHDFANALSAKLAARSRHVCVLLGAGVGKACGLLDVASLQDDIVRDLSPEEKPLLETQLASGNIEQALFEWCWRSLSELPPRPSKKSARAKHRYGGQKPWEVSWDAAREENRYRMPADIAAAILDAANASG